MSPRRTLPLLGFLSAVALLTSVAPGQRTVVVSGGGTNLQLALDAAAPGDVLDVQAADYQPVVVRRGVEVVCRDGVQIAGAFGTAVSVHQVPAGELCIWSGGLLRAGLGNQPALSVSRCRGQVVLRGTMRVVALSPLAQSGPNLVIDDNPGTVLFDGARVVSTWSRIRLSPRVMFRDTRIEWLQIADSQVSLVDCASTRLEIERGAVSITGGQVVGGVNPSTQIGDLPIDLEDAELLLSGGVTISATGLGDPECVRTAGGVVRHALDTVFVTANAMPITGSAVVRSAPFPALRTTLDPQRATAGFLTTAAPGATAAVLLDFGVAPPLSTPLGLVWVGPDALVLDLGPVGAAGARRVDLPLPPGLAAFARVQAVSWSAPQDLLLGNAAFLRID